MMPIGPQNYKHLNNLNSIFNNNHLGISSYNDNVLFNKHVIKDDNNISWNFKHSLTKMWGLIVYSSLIICEMSLFHT